MQDEQYQQRNMFETAQPPGGDSSSAIVTRPRTELSALLRLHCSAFAVC